MEVRSGPLEAYKQWRDEQADDLFRDYQEGLAEMMLARDGYPGDEERRAEEAEYWEEIHG